MFEAIRKRLEHLNQLSSGSPDILNDYYSKRLSRIIADYMLRANFFQSAKVYVEEAGL